jgi:hypothetical protein
LDLVMKFYTKCAKLETSFIADFSLILVGYTALRPILV